jgi:hypothetical protein
MFEQNRRGLGLFHLPAVSIQSVAWTCQNAVTTIQHKAAMRERRDANPGMHSSFDGQRNFGGTELKTGESSQSSSHCQTELGSRTESDMRRDALDYLYLRSGREAMTIDETARVGGGPFLLQTFDHQSVGRLCRQDKLRLIHSQSNAAVQPSLLSVIVQQTEMETRVSLDLNHRSSCFSM